MTIVFSPHYDDAVLSAGEALQQLEGPVRVVTVFTATPGDELPLTAFDMHSGFKSPGAAIGARRRENLRALNVVGVIDAVGAGHIDRQYGVETAYPQLVATMQGHIMDDPAQRISVWLPLGIAHPDHELVTLAGLDASRQTLAELTIYEDLPSRVLRPELVQPAIDHLHQRGWELERFELPRGDLDRKQAAIMCYSSQLWAVDWRACMVPERYWRVTWRG